MGFLVKGAFWFSVVLLSLPLLDGSESESGLPAAGIEVDAARRATTQRWADLIQRLEQCVVEARRAQWIVRQHRQLRAEVLGVPSGHPRPDAEGTSLWRAVDQRSPCPRCRDREGCIGQCWMLLERQTDREMWDDQTAERWVSAHVSRTIAFQTHVSEKCGTPAMPG